MTNVTKKLSGQSSAQTRRHGFTLTEIAIVLGIIGLILGAVWKAASSVYQSANVTTLQQQMGVYLASMRTGCGSSCSAAPTVTAAPPQLAGTTYAGATNNAANTGFSVGWTAIPNTTAGTNFCLNMSTAIINIGGSIGGTVAEATNGAPNGVPTCVGAAPNGVWTPPTTPAGETAVAGQNGTCSATNVATPAVYLFTYTASHVCAETTNALYAFFNYSF